MTKKRFKKCSFSLSLQLAFNERSFLTCRPLMLRGTAKWGHFALANMTERARHAKPPGRGPKCLAAVPWASESHLEICWE